MKTSKKKADDAQKRYEKVKSMLLKDFVEVLPNTTTLRKRKFRMAAGSRELGGSWFLLSDEDNNTKILIKGETVRLAGCVDDLNGYPTQSPVISMLEELGEITKAEAEGFRQVAKAESLKCHRETRLRLLKEEARSLGVKILIPPTE